MVGHVLSRNRRSPHSAYTRTHTHHTNPTLFNACTQRMYLCTCGAQENGTRLRAKRAQTWGYYTRNPPRDWSKPAPPVRFSSIQRATATATLAAGGGKHVHTRAGAAGARIWSRINATQISIISSSSQFGLDVRRAPRERHCIEPNCRQCVGSFAVTSAGQSQ